MTSINDNASASSKGDSMNCKIYATEMVCQLRLCKNAEDEDDREELPLVTNSHLNSIVTQHSNVHTPPIAASPPCREIPATAVVPVQISRY
jgi:hypothetical protein